LGFENIKEKGLKLGWFLRDIGQYDQAEAHLQSLLNKIEERYGENAKESAEICFTLIWIIRTHSFPLLIFNYHHSPS